jgi:hypothetical protein
MYEIRAVVLERDTRGGDACLALEVDNDGRGINPMQGCLVEADVKARRKENIVQGLVGASIRARRPGRS